MTLIKPAKANWHYVCETCDYTSRRSPDRSGAELFGILHLRSNRHFGNTLNQALEPARQAVITITAAFTDLGKTITGSVMPAFEQFQSDFALVPNTPHDPTVRANRRAW